MELYGSLFNISGSVTASAFTGSFVGDGSGLVGIQASGVTGLNLSQIASGDATASISTTGFTVNKNTQIQGNLSVSGALIANEYIVSSSVTYMTTSFASGSSAFGDDLMDTHKFTGSVQITGSISLNGQAIGTGKLDETTFQSYTSSNNTRVGALETSSGSLNSFTSSINTTIKSKLDSDNVISGSVQVNITGTTGYSAFSSSVSSSIGSLSSSVATTDLNQENRLTALETSSGSLNTFTSSINTTIKSKLDSESVISGSAQVNITSTTGYSTFSSSISNSINNLSGSIATTTSGLTSTITSLSSSLTSSIGELSSSVATTTLNLKNRADALEISTSSLNSFTGSINTTIKSKLDTENVISGSIQVNITGTTGYSSFSSSVSESIGNLSSSVATTTSGLSGTILNLSSSVATTTSGLSSSIGGLSSSVATTTSGISSNLTSLSSSVATTTSGLTSTITSLSSSVATTTSGISATVTNLSSSIATTTLNQTGRLDSIESKTGSYATTGSNIFKSSQTISGSVIITENLTVLGSSSITYVTSSQLRVEDNIITVNTASPGSRFGGLEVHDSGSVGIATGSLLWDSVNNRWVYQNSSEASYGGGILLSGPRSSGSLGSELTLTSGRIAKSAGGDHLNDSNITDDGTTVTVLSNTVINGTIISTGTTIVSGSSQIVHDSTTGYVANRHIDHTAVSISAGNGLSGGGDISATRTLSLDTTSATFTSGVKTKMNTDGVISGSSQVLNGSGIWSGSAQLPSGVVSGSSQVLSGTGIWSGSAQLPSGVVSGSSQVSFGGITGVPSGLVSGSSQITFGSVSGIPSGLVSGSSQISFGSVSGVPSGLVSGSSQISIASTTGFGTYLNQAVLTTSTPTFSTVSATTFTGALSGNATTASSTPALSASGALTTQAGSGTLIHTYALTAGQTGLFSTSDNSNSIITFNRHPGDYYSQLGFNSTGGIFYRSFNATAINTSQGWQTVWTSNSLTNLNQLTNGPGYITGISFANVSSKPTTLSGYGITDALPLAGGTMTGTITITNTDIRSNATSNWTGDPGTQGKIQYHANRWYIVADSSSDRIVQFRRNATDVSHIDNSGVYQGSISGNAATAGGFTPSQTSGTANRIVVADGNGYIINNYFNASGGGSERNASGMGYFAGHNTSDYYYRSYTAAAAAALLSGQAMNISGNATTASSTGTLSSNAITNGYLVIGGNYSNNAYNAVAGGTRLMFGGGDTDAQGNYYIGTNMENYGGNYNKLDLRWHTGIRMGAQQGYGGIRFFNDEDLTSVLFSIGAGDGNVRSHTNLLPSANNSYNLGNSSLRWANLYTNDLHLSNEGKEGGNEIDGTTGNWTIQEGEENLYIINHKNGKKFKIDLTEII